MKRILPILIFLSILAIAGCRRGQTHLPGSNPEDRLRTEGLRHLNLAHFDSARECGYKLLDAAERNSKSTSAIYGHLILGQSFLFSDSSIKAYNHLHTAENLALEARNDSALASVYNGLGIYALNVEKDIDETLRNFFAAMEAAGRSGNNSLQAILLLNISLCYSFTGDPLAERYALECYRRGKDSGEWLLTYGGAVLAAQSLLQQNRDTEEALRLLREAEVLLHNHNIEDRGSFHYVYGVALARAGDTRGAEESFRESIRNPENMSVGNILSFVELAEIEDRHGNPKQALALLKKAESQQFIESDIFHRGQVLNALKRHWRKTGNRDSVALYDNLLARHNALRGDSSSRHSLLVLKNKYDLERADNLVALQRIQLLEERRRLWWIIGGSTVLLLLSLITILFYRRQSKLYKAMVRQNVASAKEEAHLRETLRDTLGDKQQTGSPEKMREQTEQRHSALSAAFEALMSDPAVYTDNNISKERVAQMLETNRTYVSKIVNEAYGMSFTQFINNLRIKEAVRRLSDPEDNTPLKALAFELGYNSNTTFYKNFTDATGITPAAFRAQRQK